MDYFPKWKIFPFGSNCQNGFLVWTVKIFCNARGLFRTAKPRGTPLTQCNNGLVVSF